MLQRAAAGIAGALGLTPHPFIGMEFRGLAGQEVQRETAAGAGGPLRLDGFRLVRRQPVEHQVRGGCAGA